MNILVTGASGFVGNAFLQHAKNYNYSVRSVVRREAIESHEIQVHEIDGNTDWLEHLNDIDVVVHIAALAHDAAWQATQDDLFRVNVNGTFQLAKSAINADVRRFIFLSSIGVNGNMTYDTPFLFLSEPQPHDEYSESKYEAEKQLKNLFENTASELVIIRPPLVYGPKVKANFLTMLKWVARGVPLPLGAIRDNKRSLVYVENLIDLVRVCIEHPAAANQTFLVSDDEDVSSRELLIRVAKALGVKSRLLSIPPSWLGLAGRLLGKKDIEQRLCGSLQVDIEHTKITLGWEPPCSMEEGLARTAEWYKNRS